ncbi:hypothetical protein SAMN02927900_03503 [Rhizobium mongolense subsp. loessense]|uniref:Uncharacterized protein n=1 Tax=Rhizobium mongolense subsp. loessense TaxID=158890 RepID=A0A1G4S9E4_9HYPH|nr:hypothetical protein SAMN02927900_03503 [Rhizobium mongolense subsp. loessense]
MIVYEAHLNESHDHLQVETCCRGEPGGGNVDAKDCVRADANPWSWTLSGFSSGDGIGLYLIAGSSAAAAVLLADAIRQGDIGLDVDLWRALVSRSKRETPDGWSTPPAWSAKAVDTPTMRATRTTISAMSSPDLAQVHVRQAEIVLAG